MRKREKISSYLHASLSISALLMLSVIAVVMTITTTINAYAEPKFNPPQKKDIPPDEEE